MYASAECPNVTCGPPSSAAFSFSASILDLDPKPQDGVRRQQRLDHRVVSAYLRDDPGPSPPLYPECTLLIHPV